MILKDFTSFFKSNIIKSSEESLKKIEQLRRALCSSETLEEAIAYAMRAYSINNLPSKYRKSKRILADMSSSINVEDLHTVKLYKSRLHFYGKKGGKQIESSINSGDH